MPPLIDHAGALVSGNSKSCGCYKTDVLATQTVTHGMSNTRTYHVWCHMRSRCERPADHKYPSYGGRGITVCDRWQDFSNFLADMGECPVGMSIDRFPNNNGNYEPGNCRWADAKQQANNTRRNRYLTYNGETKRLTAWAAEQNMPHTRIHDRLKAGWSVGQALGFEYRTPYH